MPQISIPFTFDPQTNKVFITIPYDVTNVSAGSETLTIPYTVSNVSGEPDIYIPVNVGGQTLTIPIDLEEPELNVTKFSIPGLNPNRFNFPYYDGTITGTGEITVWWENYEYPIVPIDDPIWVDSNPGEPEILTYPQFPDDPQPYINTPIIADDSGYFPTPDPYISIPYEPTPQISEPFISIPLEKFDILQLTQDPPILVVDPPIEITKPQILFPLDKSIPFIVDETSEEPRILVDYTKTADGNIFVGEPLVEQIQPNINPTTTSLEKPLSSSGTNSGKTNLSDQMNGLINNVLPNSGNPPNLPSNPLSMLGVGESDDMQVSNIPYSFSSLSYPENLADDSYTGHYINFYINATAASKYFNGGSYSYSDPDGSYSYRATSAASQGGNLPGGSDNPNALPNIQTAAHQRISQAISLYIPDSMNYSQTIQWEQASLLDAGKSMIQGAGGISGALKGRAERQKGGKIANALKSLSGFGPVAEIAGNAYGFAMNPQLLVLFRGIAFRNFQYDFYFTPKNATEAKAVRKIIRAFRFHAHPELSAGYGVFYITPSTFDIEFVHKGKENKNIHKVKTCVLLKYDIDYAPAGWATYTDGMPVQTRLSLQFQETQIVTKEDIEKGY
jgi:hypothetical protein